MLLGAPFVIALVRDRCDDAGLAGVPAHSGNIGERAQLGAQAVGGDDQPRTQNLAAGEIDPRGVPARREARHRLPDRLDAERGGDPGERARDVVVERHMRERLSLARVEFQVLHPHRVADAAVVDDHVQDRLGQRLQRLPGADALEEMARPGRQRDGAHMPVALPGAWIDDGDGNAASQRLLHRRREG